MVFKLFGVVQEVYRATTILELLDKIDSGGAGKPQGSLPNNPRAAAPEAVPEPLLAHNDDAPAPPPRRSRATSAESADVDRRNMTSLVSNSDRSSRRI